MNFLYSIDPSGDLTLSPVNQPWLLGDGLFETIKSESGVLFFLDRHISRLMSASKELLFPEIDQTSLRENIGLLQSRTSDIHRGRFRITVFSNGEYLLTHQDSPLRTTPLKLFMSPVQRFTGGFLSGKKSMSYGEASVGFRYAEQHGCEDLIYLNERDEIVETGRANLLLEHKGNFTTPDLKSGCLPGVVRGVYIDWFKEVREARVTLDDLRSASGLYVLSSLREMELVTEVRCADGSFQKFQISAAAEKLRADYLINSRSLPNS